MGAGKAVNFPASISNEEALEIVRELLCGPDEPMTDEECVNAYGSEFFQELCPDIEIYAKQRREKKEMEKCSGNNGTPFWKPLSSVKQEKDNGERHESSRKVDSERAVHKSSASGGAGVEDRHASSSSKKVDGEKSSHKSSRREEDGHGSPSRKLDSERPVHKSNGGGGDQDRHASSSKTSHKSSHHEEKDRQGSSSKKLDSERSSQQHGGGGDERPGSSSKKHGDIVEIDTEKKIKQDKTAEARKKKKEPKPFSKYDSDASKTSLRRWRPVLDKEHLRNQKRFGLKPCSVVCVDLLEMPMAFHNPRNKHPKTLMSVPLRSGVDLSMEIKERIVRSERDKGNWFKKKLNKRAIKSLKRIGSNNEEPRREKKRNRIINRIDSSSVSSDIMVPILVKKARTDARECGNGKPSKQDREAEARRKMEEMKRRAAMIAGKKFDDLKPKNQSGESKDKTFNNKKKEEPSKDKDKIANNNTNAPSTSFQRIPKINPVKKNEPSKDKDKIANNNTNAPSTSFQRILHKIDPVKKDEPSKDNDKIANNTNATSTPFQRILSRIDPMKKDEAEKPKVEMRIPKKVNNSADHLIPISEYTFKQNIGGEDVYNEVIKLLSNNVLVELPTMSDSVNLGEYTVKKIAWWFLKNEKDPAPQGAYHPERHDDDDVVSIHSDDFDWPDDVSSVNGCVSDPEGMSTAIPPDPKKIADPDWADDYCGEASLYARFRRETPEGYPLDATEPFKKFMRIKPETNYSKPNFEAKCFLCNEHIEGQRQYGAHIRSDSHKNKFRDYSLKMAQYEEKLTTPVPQKYFAAQLVEYKSNSSTITKLNKDAEALTSTKLEVGKLTHLRSRSDSPGPIIAGDAAPNIMVHQMEIPDDISIPSIEDYDISSDESLMNVKVAIRTQGKWNHDLERRWRRWRDEETKIAQQYNHEREYYINEPEKHPDYQTEWLNFWDKRCDELEAEGKATEGYDFQKEWQPFWLKKMQEIMQQKVEQKVAELKRNHQVDKETLRNRFGISAAATRRKRLKKKVGRVEPENGEEGHVLDRKQNEREDKSEHRSKHEKPRDKFRSDRPYSRPYDKHQRDNYRHRDKNYKHGRRYERSHIDRIEDRRIGNDWGHTHHRSHQRDRHHEYGSKHQNYQKKVPSHHKNGHWSGSRNTGHRTPDPSSNNPSHRQSTWAPPPNEGWQPPPNTWGPRHQAPGYVQNPWTPDPRQGWSAAGSWKPEPPPPGSAGAWPPQTHHFNDVQPPAWNHGAGHH